MYSTSKPLVLVVDDHTTSLKVCSLLLDKFGYGSCCVENSQQALEMFTETDAFSIVLMDLRMPGMNGIQCMQRMREIDSDRKRYTPIIAVTAAAADSDRQHCLSAGMDDYLAKPFSYQQLQQLLSKHLRPERTTGIGLLASASEALAKNDKISADILFIQMVALMQHIFGNDKASTLAAANALADVFRSNDLNEEADNLEAQARTILGADFSSQS